MPIAKPADDPHKRVAASAIGAADLTSTSDGNKPITTVQVSMVAMPAISMPIMVARGTVRSGSLIDADGMVAASKPRNAQSAIAAEAVVTANNDSPLGLNG